MLQLSNEVLPRMVNVAVLYLLELELYSICKSPVFLRNLVIHAVVVYPRYGLNHRLGVRTKNLDNAIVLDRVDQLLDCEPALGDVELSPHT
jgi:hypothetical protein